MKNYILDDGRVSISDLGFLKDKSIQVKFQKKRSRKFKIVEIFLMLKLSLQKTIYGINTGFGSLYDHSISKDNLEQLQKNLVLSHACGTGEEVPFSIRKIMLFLKAKGLSFGHSGVQTKTVNRLIDMCNMEAIPVIYQQGSLGASGDLAPLAHMSLPLIGYGEVDFDGKRMSGEDF